MKKNYLSWIADSSFFLSLILFFFLGAYLNIKHFNLPFPEDLSIITIISLFLLCIIIYLKREIILNYIQNLNKNKFFNEHGLKILLITFLAIFILLKTNVLMNDSLGIIRLRIEHMFIYYPYVTNSLFYALNFAFLSIFGISAQSSLAIANTALGVAFIYFIFKLIKIISKKEFLLFFLIVISVPIFKVFFGHLEIYALPLVAFIIYIIYAHSYLKNKVPFKVTVLSFLLLFLTHTYAVLIIPTLLILPFFKSKWENFQFKLVFKKVIIFFIIPLILISGLFMLFNSHIIPENKIVYSDKFYQHGEFNITKDYFLKIDSNICPNCICDGFCVLTNNRSVYGKNILVPLSNEGIENGYAYDEMFYSIHYLGFLNSLFLLGPLIVLFFVCLIYFFKKKLYLKLKSDSILSLFSVLSVFYLLFLFLINYDTLPGDWDVLLLFSYSIYFWTAYIIINYWKEKKSLLVTYICLSLILTVIWIIKNHIGII